MKCIVLPQIGNVRMSTNYSSFFAWLHVHMHIILLNLWWRVLWYWLMTTSWCLCMHCIIKMLCGLCLLFGFIQITHHKQSCRPVTKHVNIYGDNNWNCKGPTLPFGIMWTAYRFSVTRKRIVLYACMYMYICHVDVPVNPTCKYTYVPACLTASSTVKENW